MAVPEPGAVRGALIHVPKTAGASIAATFRDSVFQGGHRDWAGVQQSFSAKYGPAAWNEVVRFSFVRCPWERTLSFYLYSRNRNTTVKGQPKASLVSPEDFHLWVRRSRFLEVLRPAVLFRGARLDFVGQFEHLGRDLRRVAELLGVPMPPLQHLHHNPLRARHPDWRRFYDHPTIARVAQQGAWEIKRFGYEFDGGS